MNYEESPPIPKKRLALFFDGTWNKPEDNTNVWRFRLMLSPQGNEGLAQESFYDEGIGTHWYDELSGGAFGRGLSANVRTAYRWLMEHYDHGDEVYLFGFSRGAFTARSLAGLIARCGILKPDAQMSFEQLFERYQKGDDVLPIYRLRFLKRTGKKKEFDFEERVLLEHAWYHRNLIKMVGVWDTVGSIGVPFGDFKGISRRTLRFHNTHLSTTIQHSYQALALDEMRKPYWAVLWTRFIPDQRDPDATADDDHRHIEQRWFSGAHANVGGGYRNDLLPQRPLAWIQEKAKNCGLTFRSSIAPTNEDLEMRPRDSYAEFLRGCWKRLPLPIARPYVRWVQSDRIRKKKGWVETVNERIDRSVFLRCQRYADYRPASLLEWAKRKQFNLEKIIADPDKHSDL